MLTPEQREHFDTHGYLIIEDALASIGLDRVRSAYGRMQTETESAWREEVRAGGYHRNYGNGPDAHTMLSVYQKDTLFLDLANNPQVIPLLEEIVGPELQVMEIICHCHHAGTKAHTGWHRDWPPWSHPKYILKAKVFYFLDDQDEDMGCFTLVPGSHKHPDGPPKDLYNGPTLEDMPGLKKIAPRAGSAIIWNVSAGTPAWPTRVNGIAASSSTATCPSGSKSGRAAPPIRPPSTGRTPPRSARSWASTASTGDGAGTGRMSRISPNTKPSPWPRACNHTYDLAKAKDLTGPAGTAILFNARMIHAGNVRRTPVERRTVHIYCGLIPDRPLSNFTIFPRRLSEGRDAATQKYYSRPNPISRLLRERF